MLQVMLSIKLIYEPILRLVLAVIYPVCFLYTPSDLNYSQEQEVEALHILTMPLQIQQDMADRGWGEDKEK